jgi:hypothetical protein
VLIFVLSFSMTVIIFLWYKFKNVLFFWFFLHIISLAFVVYMLIQLLLGPNFSDSAMESLNTIR